jgi:hypothetical protein
VVQRPHAILKIGGGKNNNNVFVQAQTALLPQPSPGAKSPLVEEVLVGLVLVLRGVAALAHHPRGVALHQLALPIQALLLPPLPANVPPLLLHVRVLKPLHELSHVVVAAGWG